MGLHDELLDRILGWDRSRRHIVAVAGPPGVGKSTFAVRLAAALDEQAPGLSAVLEMDGFHFDDAVLEDRGHRSRKGAPHTFDTGGLLAALVRLVADDGQDVAVPRFDRAMEVARAGARIIEPSARVIIVEGNYLLLDDPRWAPLRRQVDLTVLLRASEDLLVERLGARWDELGYDADAKVRKLEENDLPNARLVLEHSVEADVVIDQSAPSRLV